MKQAIIAAVLLAATIIAGCGLAEGPRQKFQHTVFRFNEGLRWGYQSDVLPKVAPDAREHFVEMHEGWGEIVQISNAEVVESVYDEESRKATVTVKFTWYRKDEMVVNTTTTRQHWEHIENEWLMVAEEHLGGTPF